MAEIRVCYITEPWAGNGNGTTIAVRAEPFLAASGTTTAATLWTWTQAGMAAGTTITAFSTAVTRLARITVTAAESMRALNAAWPARYGITPADAGAVLAAARQEAAERELSRQVADARATQLLLSVLTGAERESYTRDGFIELQGSAGGWWRIRRSGQAGNVDELEAPGGPRIASWCCHPPGGLPDADAHLAQLLHLATDEPGFRATGNRTPRGPALLAA